MFRYFFLVSIVVLSGCVAEKPAPPPPKKEVTIDFSKGALDKTKVIVAKEIQWDQSSIRLLTEGLFGRIVKTSEGILCFYEDKGGIYVKSGTKDLSGLGEAVKVAEFPNGIAISPNACVLDDGSVICFYIESPTEDFKEYFKLKWLRVLMGKPGVSPKSCIRQVTTSRAVAGTLWPSK